MSKFIWDKGNRKHATEHGVSIPEIEEVFRRNPFVDAHEEAEYEEANQFRAYGTTAKGRYVTIPFTIRGGDFRVISAWPMTEEEFETYADQIRIHPTAEESENE